MQTSDKISIGALVISLVSILVAGTTVINRNTYDLGALAEAVGDVSKPSGLYAQVDVAKRDALTAKTLSENNKSISNEARQLATLAEKTATSSEKDAQSALSKITNAENMVIEAKGESLEARNLALQANDVSQKALLNSVPIGTILPWIPTDSLPLPPKGWKVCDGANGTPDLEGRFLLGVRHINKTQNKGGIADIPNQGNHNHGGATTSVNSNRIAYDRGGDNNGVWFDHSHGIQGDGGHNHGGDNHPPYFTVIFIIKTN